MIHISAVADSSAAPEMPPTFTSERVRSDMQIQGFP